MESRKLNPPLDILKALLILHKSFPHNSSGYSVRSHEIATSLLGLGVDLSVYTRPGFPWCEQVNGDVRDFSSSDFVEKVTYNRLPNASHEHGYSGKKYRELSQYTYIKVLERTKAKLVHAASDFECGLPAVLAANSLNVKSIYEYRGMWHYTKTSRIPWFSMSSQYQERHAFEIETGKKADVVFSISEALKFDLIDNGINERKIYVVPNSVHVDRFIPQTPNLALKRDLGIKNQFVIGFIGSITNYEGLEVLIDATIRLNLEKEKVVLLIVGDGFHLNYLKNYHIARGSPRCIIFIGRVPFSQVNGYYSIIDAAVFPRLNHEVCQKIPPLKPLEAMAMKKPIIVSDLCALREVVKHGETGLVCTPGSVNSLVEKIGLLANDADLRDSVVDNAYEWVVKSRDWRVTSKKISEIYANLIS